MGHALGVSRIKYLKTTFRVRNAPGILILTTCKSNVWLIHVAKDRFWVREASVKSVRPKLILIKMEDNVLLTNVMKDST